MPDELNMAGEPSAEPFDVIVPTHNNLGLTIQCMDALYTNTKIPFHLVIVDDSTDLTPLYIRNLQREKDNITFIHSDEPYKTGNQFFNVAFEKCKYKYVATVMNSVRVEPDWEVVGINLLNQNKEIGTVGLKCLLPDGKIESAGIAMLGFQHTYNATADIGRGLPGHRLSLVYEVDAVQWALALHRMEALTGNIDPDIFYGFKGWDDLDNCFALRKKGWKIYYCGMGVGYHKPRATRGTTSNEAFIQNRINAEKFFKRWDMWEDYKKFYGLGDDYEGLKEGDSMPDKLWSVLQTIDASDN